MNGNAAADFTDLSPPVARQAIETLVKGEPPPLQIIDQLSVGLERDLKTFTREYFRSGTFLTSAETVGTTFKIIEAYYGGGKTHYLRCVERTAHKHNFASAFVGLKRNECPLTRFDLIYQAVVDSLTIPPGNSPAPERGFGAFIRHWVEQKISQSDGDAFQLIEPELDAIGDLPVMSIKQALRTAVMCHLSQDHETFDEALAFLTSGRLTPNLRRRGVSQPVTVQNGSLALRSIAALIRKMGYSGFILILDEGDRSLSLGSGKELVAASNNLVQLINETAAEGAWPSTMLLYSIPSWQSFSDAFSTNQALIQRVAPTGFPLVPPAPRIVLDERQRTDQEKQDFCVELGQRLCALFRRASPDSILDDSKVLETAQRVAKRVLHYETSPSFRRLFVQSFLASLYVLSEEGMVKDAEVDAIIQGHLAQLRKSGH